MANREQWVFIVNPVAGNGFAGEYAGMVREMIRRRGIEAEVVFTTGRGHATVIAEEYANKGFKYIIGVGGDGTFNEIVQGIVEKKNIIFGAVSAGTGNDFINILGFSERFTEEDWDVFFQKNIIGMDIGTCNGMYFVNGMGLGFDAQVAAENYKDSEGDVKKGSKSKYWWHIIKTLVMYREMEMRLQVNGSVKQTKSFLNTIANGRRLAGAFYLTPDAIANDGLLDVCMIDELSFPGRILELLSVLRRTHTRDRVVRYFQADHLHMEFAGRVPAHLDGEVHFDSVFDIGIIPAGIRTIYNPRGRHFFKKD